MKLQEIKNPMSRFRFATSSELFYFKALIPFSAGILFSASTIGLFASTTVIYAITFLLLLLLIFLNLNYSKYRLYRRKLSLSIGIYLTLFIVGYSVTIVNNQLLFSNHFSKNTFNYLKIVVNQEPQVKNGILLFKSKAVMGFRESLQVETSGNLLIRIRLEPNSKQKIAYGDVLLIPNSSKKTQSNPNPSTFDYQRWLAKQQIFHQAYLSEAEGLPTGIKHGNWVIKKALEIRKTQVNYFRTILKDDNVYSVASTLILGYRADLDEEILSHYAKTGTIHALSVSGMHVGLIYIVLNWMLSFLNRNNFSRLLKLLITLLLIWSYTVLTGISPPVLRAAIMISCFIIGKGINRSADGINILAFSAFMILINDPYVIWDVGFQLSYIAVLGLILLQPILESWVTFKHLFFRKIWSAISISIAAQLFTFPLSIYYFHQFPVYFLLSNLFILVPVTVIMYLGIVILLFRLTILAGIFEWLVSATNSGLRYIAEMPESTLSQIWISDTELLLLTATLGLMVTGIIYYNKNLVRYSMLFGLAFQLVSLINKIEKSNQRKIVIFNIKKYYAVAFVSGNEAIVMTNLKTDEKKFKQNIRPFLDHHGVMTTVCTIELDSIERHYLKVQGDEIKFYDYLMSRSELKKFHIEDGKAVVKNID
jgi:competence protein ComEC